MKFNLTIDYTRLNYVFLFYFLILSGIYLSKFSPDYFNYLSALSSQIDLKKFEPGFWFIVYLNKVLFNDNPYTFYFIFETIEMIIWYIVLIKYSYNLYISFFIFLFIFYPNEVLIQIRQGLAIAIFFLAIEDIINRRKFKYFVKIFFAIMFHYSALILLFFYFINHKKINRYLYILLPILGVLIGKLILNLNLINFLIHYLPLPLQFKLNGYLMTKSLGDASINKINIFNFFSISLLVIYYFVLFKIIRKKYFILFTKLLGIGLFFWFACAILPVLSFRISWMFYPSIIFLLSYIPFLFKNKFEKNFIFILIIFWSLLVGLNMYIIHGIFKF